MALFSGMSRSKYGMLKRSYYAQPKPPGISRVWGQMSIDELDDKKEKDEEKAEALIAEANYAKWNSRQGGGGGRGSCRGGRGGGTGGRGRGGRESGSGSGGVSGDTRVGF